MVNVEDSHGIPIKHYTPFNQDKLIHSLKLTVRTCQEAIPKQNLSSNHPFSGAMLLLGRV